MKKSKHKTSNKYWSVISVPSKKLKNRSNRGSGVANDKKGKKAVIYSLIDMFPSNKIKIFHGRWSASQEIRKFLLKKNKENF